MLLFEGAPDHMKKFDEGELDRHFCYGRPVYLVRRGAGAAGVEYFGCERFENLSETLPAAGGNGCDFFLGRNWEQRLMERCARGRRLTDLKDLKLRVEGDGEGSGRSGRAFRDLAARIAGEEVGRGGDQPVALAALSPADLEDHDRCPFQKALTRLDFTGPELRRDIWPAVRGDFEETWVWDTLCGTDFGGLCSLRNFFEHRCPPSLAVGIGAELAEKASRVTVARLEESRSSCGEEPRVGSKKAWQEKLNGE